MILEIRRKRKKRNKIHIIGIIGIIVNVTTTQNKWEFHLSTIQSSNNILNVEYLI